MIGIGGIWDVSCGKKTRFFIETLHPLSWLERRGGGGEGASSKHFGQPKETHLPADKHGESPWRRRTVLALPRGEVERGMCLGLFALQDNIPSLLKDESRERSAAILSPSLYPLSPLSSFRGLVRPLSPIFLRPSFFRARSKKKKGTKILKLLLFE